MAEYDGSIKFDTKLDTSGFQEGISRLSSESLKGFGAVKNAALNGTSAADRSLGDFTKTMSVAGSASAKFGNTITDKIKNGASNAFDFLRENVQIAIADMTSTFGKMDKEYTYSSLLIDSLAVAIQKYTKEASHLNLVSGLGKAVLAGLGDAFKTVFFGMHDSMTVYDDLREKNDATVQSLNNEKDAWGNLKVAMEQNTVAETAKIDRAIALQGELAKIADESGRVAEVDKARASYLLGEMNEALGTEFTMTGNMIDQYGTMAQTIDEVTAAGRGRAVLEANQQLQAAATYGQLQKQMELEEQQIQMEETKLEMARLAAEQSKINRDVQGGEYTELSARIRELDESLDNQKNTYADTQAQADEYSNVLKKYGAIEEAIANGSAVDINKAVSDFLETVKTGDTVLTDSSAAVDEAGRRLQIAKESYERTAEAVAKGADPKLLEASKQKFLEAADGYAEVGGTAMKELLSGFQSEDDELLAGLAAIAGVSVDTLKQSLGINSPSAVMAGEVGVPMVQGIAAGAQSESSNLNATLKSIVRGAIDAAKAEAAIQSPSRVMRDEVGLMFSKGLALGITDGEGMVVSAAEGVASAAVSAVSAVSSADILEKLGKSFVNGLAENDKGNTEKYRNKLDVLDLKKDFGLSEQEYYAELARLRNEFLAEGTKEWYEATKDIYKYQKSAAEKAEKAAEKARERERDELDRQHDAGLLSEARYIEELTAYRSRYFAEGTEEFAELTEEINKLSRKNELDMLEFRYDMGLLTEQAYYHKLLEYRDKHFVKGSADWLEYTKKIRSYNVSQIKAAYDTIAEYAGEKLGDIISKQEALYSKLDDYGSLMKTITVKNYYEDGSDLQFNELNDISKDNDFLRQYNENITAAAERLKNSGLSEETAARLYDRLLDMSPEEASDFAALLTKATNEEFEKYITDYQEKMDLLDEVSKNPFREAWAEASDDVGKKIKQSFDDIGMEVPEQFQSIGRDAADNFSSGFTETLSQLFDVASEDTSINKLLNEQLVEIDFGETAENASLELVSALEEAGFEVPDTFSGIGESSAEKFGRSFLTELEQQMEAIKGKITGWTFSPVPQLAGAAQGSTSTVYSPTYNLYGSGETDIQRIQSAKAYSERDRMAGGY